MIAVIEVWWNQFNVKVGDIIDVKKLDANVDDVASIEALLVSDEDWKDSKIGTPFVDWSKVEYKVLEQYKWSKVRVFKMHAKKRYMKNNWFRPSLTKIEILSIA